MDHFNPLSRIKHPPHGHPEHKCHQFMDAMIRWADTDPDVRHAFGLDPGDAIAQMVFGEDAVMFTVLTGEAGKRYIRPEMGRAERYLAAQQAAKDYQQCRHGHWN